MTQKSSTVLLDLDTLSYADTVEYAVKHPDPRVKDVLGTILVAGPGHAQVLATEEADRKRDLEELQDYQIEAKEAIDAGRPIPRTPDERRLVADVRKRNAGRLAARVISADFSVKLDGKVVELNSATAGEILANPRVSWLFDGLYEFVSKRANFIPTSAK